MIQNNFDRNIFEEIKGVNVLEEANVDNVTVSMKKNCLQCPFSIAY